MMSKIALARRRLTLIALAVALAPAPLFVSAQSGQRTAPAPAVATSRAGAPTFNRDIAPLLHQNCATCHRAGEVAPFPLLTYADAAKRVCDALRATGVEVWFDQSELVGGDAWDAKIRRQIATCALFMPIISASTQARREGYFRIALTVSPARLTEAVERLGRALDVVRETGVAATA
jgi:hypothetical protein